MLPCARLALETLERLEMPNAEFTKTLLEVVKPMNLADLPNPYDEELFLSGDDDGPGLEPHKR